MTVQQADHCTLEEAVAEACNAYVRKHPNHLITELRLRDMGPGEGVRFQVDAVIAVPKLERRGSNKDGQ